MGKRAEKITPAKDSQSSSAAMKKSDYTDLVGKVAKANNTMDTARERKSQLISDAVDGKKLHKGAFAWVMRLRKMDPVKRNEFLFHFDVYCDYENFAREDLLSDRGGGEPDGVVGKVVDSAGVERKIQEDGEPDLRPIHLRQPGASAADAVQEMASKAGAQSSGRGKPN